MLGGDVLHLRPHRGAAGPEHPRGREHRPLPQLLHVGLGPQGALCGGVGRQTDQTGEDDLHPLPPPRQTDGGGAGLCHCGDGPRVHRAPPVRPGHQLQRQRPECPAGLRVEPRGRPVRRAAEVCGHDADGQAAAVHFAGAGAGPQVRADDEGRHRERDVGAAAELPLGQVLDAHAGAAGGELPGGHQPIVPAVADLQPQPLFPGVHPAERREDDERASQGIACQSEEVAAVVSTGFLGAIEKARPLQEADVRALLLPRADPGTAEVWGVGLEHFLRIQYRGLAVLRAAAAGVPGQVRPGPVHGHQVPDRADQLRRAGDRRLGPPHAHDAAGHVHHPGDNGGLLQVQSFRHIRQHPGHRPGRLSGVPGGVAYQCGARGIRFA
mmetsp:Transcript_23304/g.40048  ORF Transcript_23304/g.40048 Transcript_23304/m.40048 type:complete len:381 (+) Transcript_23304:1378-2520(+)